MTESRNVMPWTSVWGMIGGILAQGFVELLVIWVNNPEWQNLLRIVWILGMAGAITMSFRTKFRTFKGGFYRGFAFTGTVLFSLFY